MADYRERYAEIASLGATLAAVSVDPPQVSESLRAQLSLPFPLLCDTDRRVITDWSILNAKERGGIAKPAVFVIDRDRTVRFASVDDVVRRVPAAEMLSLLRQPARSIRRKAHVPGLSNWSSAIRNALRPKPDKA